MRPTNLEDFLGHALEVCEDTDHDVIEAIFMTDDDGFAELTCMYVEPGETPEPAEVDKFFAGDHGYAGMVTRVSWSPNDTTPFGPSWMLVAVRKGQQSAAFMVGRVDLEEWWQLMPEQAPWFALSTAGSLRKVLDGESMPPIKKARDGDPKLFGILGAGAPTPPEDEHGRI